ncbi:LacI family DNA-binding transcriptional regulator [Mycobacterium shigaense]|nr:LacI family DNA-binding transcriptional regulator [Mycobacterium shigaense]
MAGPGGKGTMTANKFARPTNADVARLAGVSTATVSYVLNNAQGRKISPQTRDAVHRAAQSLGYRPNLAARNLARGKSSVVVYVVPHVALGEMPMQAGSRMTTALARLGLLQVQIFETEDDRHVVDAIQNLDPIAVTSLFPLSAAARAAIRAAGIPHINIGTLPALGEPHLSVGEMRVAHLVSRGHQRMAFAYTGIPRWRELGDYWFEGVSRATRSRQLPPLAVAVVTPETAEEVVIRWVRDGVSAVCAQSDEIACMVLYGMHQARLRCPDDLAVIGADASAMGLVSTPPLTTVKFEPRAVADVALAAVYDQLGYPAEAAPQSSDIARLVVRATT